MKTTPAIVPPPISTVTADQGTIAVVARRLVLRDRDGRLIYRCSRDESVEVFIVGAGICEHDIGELCRTRVGGVSLLRYSLEGDPAGPKIFVLEAGGRRLTTTQGDMSFLNEALRSEVGFRPYQEYLRRYDGFDHNMRLRRVRRG